MKLPFMNSDMSPKPVCWSPSHPCDCFWKQSLYKVIKVKWENKSWAQIQQVWCANNSKRHLEGAHAEERPWEDTVRRVTVHWKKKASSETSPAGTLILDSQPPELRENGFPLVKLPRLQHFASRQTHFLIGTCIDIMQ